MTRAASDDQVSNDYADVDRKDAGRKKSTYHTHMFLLFQLEFMHESRDLQPNDFHNFLRLVQAQRERCALFAALQRVAHACRIEFVPSISYDQIWYFVIKNGMH